MATTSECEAADEPPSRRAMGFGGTAMFGKLRNAILYVRRQQTAARQFGEQVQLWSVEVNGLGLAEAKAEAAEALADPALFACVRSPGSGDERLEPLAPALRAFFEEYEDVEAIRTGEQLARVLIAPSAVLDGFIAIGVDGEHAEAAVKPDEEIVYVLADDAPREEARVEHYPSVHHYLAFAARVGRVVPD